jgi:hypothetical protein
MQIKVNKQGYITDYAFVGTLVGGEEISMPSDLDHFTAHFTAYKVQDGDAVFDEEKELANTQEEAVSEYRKRRENECFSVINRGQLWYDTLSDTQKEELNKWYRAWLDGTDTLIIPQKPSWLK